MSMRILAIDTTTEFGSLALIEDGQTAAEILLHSRDGFSQILYGHVASLLASCQCSLASVDGFAAAAGPGSFTGVRVGLTAVMGFAAALDRPVVPVSNLQAIAAFGSAELRAPVIDARRGDIYGAVYDAELQVVSPEVVMRFPEWLKTLPAGNVEFLATDFSPFRGALEGTPYAASTAKDVPRALAAVVGKVAAARFAAGAGRDPADIDANYVRRSDAELFWKEL